jgi:hypothetical protein
MIWSLDGGLNSFDTYAKTMQYQTDILSYVISVCCLLKTIGIRLCCEENYIKLSNIFPIEDNVITTRRQRWFIALAPHR